MSYSNANIRIILIREKALSMIETHTRYIDIYIIHMVYIVCVTLRERERERERGCGLEREALFCMCEETVECMSRL